LFFAITVLGQKPLNVFRQFGNAELDSFRLTRPLRFYEILCSKTGQHKFTSSFGLVRDKGMQIEIIFYTWGDDKTKKLSRNYAGEDSIISMHESTGNIVFFASHDSRIYWQPGDDGGTGFTPFNFPPINKPNLKVSKIWIDTETYLKVQESGYLVKNPSILIKKVAFIRKYEIHDGISTPKQVLSVVDTRLVGKAELTIEFTKFEIESSRRASAETGNQ
jgi:hypothetical protein